jgi:hypothetical protein
MILKPSLAFFGRDDRVTEREFPLVHEYSVKNAEIDESIYQEI